MAGAAAAGRALPAACAEGAPVGGGGSAGGSGAVGPVSEPDFGINAVAGGGLVPAGGKGSPLGWSLALYKNPSGQFG